MTARQINGVWFADVKVKMLDGTSRRVRRKSPIQTKREALRFERQIRDALAAGTFEAPVKRRLTFREFSADYLRYAKTHNKPSTLENKIIILEKRLLPHFGELPLEQISIRHIEAFKDQCTDLGRKPKTVNNYLADLKKLLNLAVEYGELTAAPRIKMLKVPEKRPDFLSAEEADLIIESSEPEWRAMIVVALNTGLRLGELLGLSWRDVNLVRREITVRHNNYRGQILSPKSCKERVIPLNDPAYFVLKGHDSESEWLWPAPGGKPAKPHFARGGLKRAIKKSGGRHFGWHIFRHTFASNLATAGVPLISIKELLGHASIEQTMRYAHLAPNVNREAVNALHGQGLQVGAI